MRTFLRTSLLLTLVLTAACGGDDDPAAPITDESVVAQYTLRSVSGQGMPFTAARTDDLRLDILSGKITVAADRSYTDQQIVRITVTGESPVTDTVIVSGTWVRNENALVITVPNGEFVVLLRNNQLLKQESGFTYDYRK